MDFASPAKINLFFYIKQKRSDGYHEVASIMQTVNLVDTLSLAFSEQDEFRCNLPQLVFENNLVLQALNLFRLCTKKNFSLKIHLEKNIPMGAGLGGGSSNAATTLWALNQMAGFPLSEKDLIELGAKLGSDVPFFFSNGSALCTGRGENIKNIKIAPRSFYVAYPEYLISTPAVYKKVDIGQLEIRNLDEIMESYKAGDFVTFNDLEPFAFQLEPKLKQFKSKLATCGFKKVLMTGSGSAFFAMERKKELQTDFPVWKVESIYREQGSWFE